MKMAKISYFLLIVLLLTTGCMVDPCSKEQTNFFDDEQEINECLNYEVICESIQDKNLFFSVEYTNKCDKDISILIKETKNPESYIVTHQPKTSVSSISCYPAYIPASSKSHEIYYISADFEDDKVIFDDFLVFEGKKEITNCQEIE